MGEIINKIYNRWYLTIHLLFASIGVDVENCDVWSDAEAGKTVDDTFEGVDHNKTLADLIWNLKIKILGQIHILCYNFNWKKLKLDEDEKKFVLRNWFWLMYDSPSEIIELSKIICFKTYINNFVL